MMDESALSGSVAIVRRDIREDIPLAERRLSGNEPGSSDLPTTERYGEPEHVGEAGNV
jgi:hypothetical protein